MTSNLTSSEGRLSRILSSLALSMAVGGLIVLPGTVARGQVEPTLRVTFEPPTDRRLDDSAGGASRPSDRKCNGDESVPVSMVALMPDNTREGLTLTDRPTVFAYVPPTSASIALFSLQDEAGEVVYQQNLPLPETDGIASITLPPEAPPLALDRTYKWSLGILCEPVQTDFPIANGKIRRIALTSAELENITPLERAVVYGESGLWYDTLAVLDRLRRSQPEDATVAAIWQDLLDSVGLEDVSTKPPLNWD